jgi:FkbM family methyltransferase
MLPDRYFLVPVPGGRIYLQLNESPMMVARALRLYERVKFKRLRRITRPGMTAIDVGANKGDFTLLLAKLTGDSGMVLAFEPDPENCSWVRKSISVNGYRNVRLFECALADTDSDITFYPGRKSGWGSLIPQNQTDTSRPPLTVPARRLDSILEEANVEDVDVMKIDVEGGELLVLQGALGLLTRSKRLRLVMDVDVDSRDQRAELLEILYSRGFQVRCPESLSRPLKTLLPEIREIYAWKEA